MKKMKHKQLMSELTEIFGDQTKTLLKNFYGLGEGFDLESIDNDLKDKQSLSGLVKFLIKEKERYISNNRVFNSHVEVLRTDGVNHELFIGDNKPYFLSDWEGVSRVN